MRRDSVLLLVAFAAVAAAFVGSTMVAQRAAHEVGGVAASIARDAAPGLGAIANVRGEVRRLQALISRQTAMGAAPTDKEAIDEARQTLDKQLAARRAWPTARGEAAALYQPRAAR